MRVLISIFLFFQSFLLSVDCDFDIAIVGTSPTCMLEAIYHIAKDKRVLILEEDEQCGGAWKSINICGLRNVDLGCHLIGSDYRVKEFFEKYFGCRFVCLEHPYQEADSSHVRCSNGFYFSGGCHELISNLETKIRSYPNAAIINQKLQSVFVDSVKKCVELNLGDRRCTTGKLILTPASDFRVENPHFVNLNNSKHDYKHLYILVEDPSPVHFTYLNGFATGMSRAMNLTPFLETPSDGRQLIVIQTYGISDAIEAQKFVEAFKNKGLLAANAQILSMDIHTYNQLFVNVSSIQRLGGDLIEILDTSSFLAMSKYFEKWKSVMVPIR